MTNVLERIAKEVIVEEFDMIVDGKPFPWLLSERGPLVTKFADDYYVVDVEIIAINRENYEYLDFGCKSLDGSNNVPAIPVIGGVEFPWVLTDDALTLTFGYKQYPLLHLRFPARNVSGDVQINDHRHVCDDQYCYGGHLVHAGPPSEARELILPDS